jgi:hypothetical protein
VKIVAILPVFDVKSQLIVFCKKIRFHPDYRTEKEDSKINDKSEQFNHGFL